MSLVKKMDAQNIEVIILMPMQSNRLKELGLNQSLEIAKVITKNHPEKLVHAAEKRQRYSPPKVSLPLKERTKTLKGCLSQMQI
jgi:predicted amidophosphoribosyltransferase